VSRWHRGPPTFGSLVVHHGCDSRSGSIRRDCSSSGTVCSKSVFRSGTSWYVGGRKPRLASAVSPACDRGLVVARASHGCSRTCWSCRHWSAHVPRRLGRPADGSAAPFAGGAGVPLATSSCGGTGDPVDPTRG